MAGKFLGAVHRDHPGALYQVFAHSMAPQKTLNPIGEEVLPRIEMGDGIEVREYLVQRLRQGGTGGLVIGFSSRSIREHEE